MNLRIKGQNLRFRISKEELETLCCGCEVTQRTLFPGQRALGINIITRSMENTLQVTFEEDSITLCVHAQAAEDLYHALPSREGIQARQKIHAMQMLELALEVDIRTQKRRRGSHAS